MSTPIAETPEVHVETPESLWNGRGQAVGSPLPELPTFPTASAQEPEPLRFHQGIFIALAWGELSMSNWLLTYGMQILAPHEFEFLFQTAPFHVQMYMNLVAAGWMPILCTF